MTDIVMPRLTDSMEEGTVVAWLRQDGDEIAVGDDLVEIETDKASMVYEADAAGPLTILVPEGETLEIGTPIARVGEEAATVGDSDGRASPGVPSEPPTATASSSGKGESGVPPEPSTADASAASDSPSHLIGEVKKEQAPSTRVKASPIARRMAADRGVDLATLIGSGPGGRIIRVDVERAGSGGRPSATAAEPVRAGEAEVVALSRIQQTIARRMAESKATIPHFVLRTEVDMRRTVAAREAFKQEAGDRPAPSFNDFVVKATARALKLYPRANATFQDDSFHLYPQVNVGIAVAAEDALIVPVIADADRKDLRTIAAESRRLAERVRAGEITPPEVTGGTFTISNLGMFGVSGFDAVINPGQAGILAVGELAGRPVVEDGGFAVGQVMELSLSCDHRILYGADGAEFLAAIRVGLEEPALLA